jgi:predicted MFS family arabinose efflux permease
MEKPEAGTEPITKRAEQALMPQTTVWLMAITVGVIVANIYYVQPLLADIASTFGLTVTRAGTVAMLSQVGTALGMFLFVPLGDKYERRSLILLLVICEFVSLLLIATAQNAIWLGFAAFGIGFFAANVHVVVPFAAHLAAPQQRGRVVGTVVAGILFGVLLARTFSGSIGALLGWRAVYVIAAGAMLILAVLVRTKLPVSRPEVILSWPELMRSTFRLVRQHAVLRESALLGALFFAAFSAFWTTLVFFLGGPSYQYAGASAVTGFFGLIGAVGAAGAPTIGHLADKHGPRFTIRVALWLSLIAFLFLGFAGQHLAGLIAGVILMDLGVQSGHVSNQTRIYSIDPSARSRLNMVYMFCYFIGGALGSYLGAWGWHVAGWWGVCGFGAAAIFLAIIAEFTYGRRALANGIGEEALR